MNEFLEDLLVQLKTIISASYQDWALEGQALPFLEFRFPSGSLGSADSKESRNKMLEIDIYCRDTDIKTIETQIDNLDNLLDQKSFVGTGYFCRLSHESRFSIPEPDNKLRRRQLRYSVKFTKRS